MKRSFDIHYVIEFKKRRAYARRVLQNAKQSHCRNSCNSLNSNSNISTAWTTVKSMNGSRTCSTIKSLWKNDQRITNRKDIANCLAERFSSISFNPNLDKQFLVRRSTIEATYGSSNSPEKNNNHGINTIFQIRTKEGPERKKGFVPRQRWHMLLDDRPPAARLRGLSRRLAPLQCNSDTQKRKT